MKPLAQLLLVVLACGSARADGPKPAQATPLPGTKALTMTGDIASHLVAGVDKFLLKKLEQSVDSRATFWKRDLSSADAYNESVAPNRRHLAHILGVRDARVVFDGLTLVSTTTQPSLVGRGGNYDVHAVRWPAFGDVHG